MKSIFTGAILLLLAASRADAAAAAATPNPLNVHIGIIRAVDAEGKGNEKARAAWLTLVKSDLSALPSLLSGMDGANELAANWLRAAVDAITERELKAGAKLPVFALEVFLMDTKHEARARRLAFELIQRADAAKAESLIAGMIDDPSVELRRDAVQRLLDIAAAHDKAKRAAEAGKVFETALTAARDLDQIDTAALKLRQLGKPVDLPRHFGFLTHWKVAGPFDNTARKGFAAVFPPEQKIQLDAKYPGKAGEMGWVDLVAGDEYGKVNVNDAFGPVKEATAYAYSEFQSDKARPCELRLACKNAWKIWLNGKLIFGHDEYHRGTRIDHYRLNAELLAGRNTILVKLCQNEQKETWTVEWEFQLRVCDATGTAILATNRPPTPAPKATVRKPEVKP
ncbi:MAG: hypothetical protein EXS22_05670 [Pedosphaera sp.]|nr:hypothetical protein [Pedosphaera sp.]MSU43509.1 hypothetical protein [Pedosphaera sp.]